MFLSPATKFNSPEVLYLTAPKQPDTAGATTPTPSATSPTTFTKSSHLPHKHLPQTRNTNDPGPPDYWAEHFSALGSARSNQPSFPPGQSNVRNAAPTTQSSPSSDFPPTHRQTKHQQCSQQQTSNVVLSHQKTSNLGYSQSSQSNIGQATTTQSLPTCNYQRYSQAGSSHPGTNSSTSVVYNPRPLPPNQTAERTQSGAQTSMGLAHPASQPSHPPASHPILGVYPIGTNFFPIIGSGNTKQNQGSTTAGPNGNFVMVGAPIVSKQPTLVLNNHLPPINCSQKAISGQLSRASTDTHPIPTHPCSVTSFYQNTAAPLLNHTTPMASPSPAAEYSSNYSSGTSHDAVLPVRDLTHKQIHKATSVPSPPLTNPSNQLQSPPAHKTSKSLALIASNPLLYQIILHCPSSSGGTSGALTSDPEHTQPGNDHDSEPKESPPIPQERPPTPKTVKALADSACDISSSPGLGEHLLAPNIQENELTSTVSDTRLIEGIPLIISELLTLWEDGGELSDSEDDARPTDLGVQKTTPASPASLQCEDIHSETHREAGGTEATDVRPDVTNASSGSAGCSNKELAFVKTVSATSQLRPMSEMLKNLEHSATPLKRRHSAQKLTNMRTSTDCQKQPGTNWQKKHGTNRQKYPRTNRRKKQPKDSGSVSSKPLSSSESSARPESPGEDSVSLEPLSDEPSKNDIREAGSGMALMGDPGSFSPVVSLIRLPISSFVPLPRFFIHAGDREQELYLEEMVEDNVVGSILP